jgi:hypothetical protein
MLANMTSYALARSLRPLPIYDALLVQDGIELPRSAAHMHALRRISHAASIEPQLVPAPVASVSEPAPVASASDSQSTPPLLAAPELKAASLMQRFALWPASTTLAELLRAQPEASCYLMCHGEGYAALSHAELTSLLRANASGPSVPLSAVARSAPLVQPASPLSELARVLQDADVPAAVVSDTRAQGHVGVITRELLANELLDWFSKARPARRSGRQDPSHASLQQRRPRPRSGVS